MNISQGARILVAIVVGTAAVVTGVKTLIDAGKNLNGWHVLFALSILVLTILGVDWCRQCIEARFVKFERASQNQNQELSRAIGGLGTQCDSRIGTIAQEFDTKLTKEIDSRVAGEVTDRNRMSDIETRVGKMEAWFKTKGVTL